MKFIVVGSTRGEVDLINSYLDRSQADFALCTGDLGILYKNVKSTFLPKSFINNQFYEYLDHKKVFNKPVYVIRGIHDNLNLCRLLSKEYLNIENFHLIGDGDIISHNDIKIGGIGGGYSSKYFNCDFLLSGQRRYFCKTHVKQIKSIGDISVLLLHDLVGNCTKKHIEYSSETYSIIQATNPFYCFIGKYHWWGYSRLNDTNVVMLPYANQGYLLVDIDNEWNAEGIRFDITSDKVKGYNGQ